MICTEKLPVPAIKGGAIQTYISGVLPHLSSHHEITVLGIEDPSLKNEEMSGGVRYVRIPGKRFELYKNGVVNFLENHENSFDIIHIFNRPRLVLPVRSASGNARIILSMHNDMFNPEKIPYEEAVRVVSEVERIVTVSNYVGNVIKSLYPQAAPKLKTIYSGVDTDRFLPGSHKNMERFRNKIRKKYGLENKTVILYAGRLSHNKGADRLIRALPLLAKKYDDLALVVIGSNWFSENHLTDFVAYIRALAKRQPVPVITTGFIHPDEIHQWFAAADLFVCTSVWQEPLARVHYEAMAAGLPIVTTARGGNPEVIMEGKNGLVVKEPEDPANFAEAISKLLDHKETMKKMGETNRQLAVSCYKWERVAADILSVWHNHPMNVKSNTAATIPRFSASAKAPEQPVHIPPPSSGTPGARKGQSDSANQPQ